MDGEDDDRTPEATFCEVCKPIFADNSYEEWSKAWEKSGPRSQLYSRHMPYNPHHLSRRSLKDAQEQQCSICSEIPLPYYHPNDGSFPLKYHLHNRSFTLGNYSESDSVTILSIKTSKDLLRTETRFEIRNSPPLSSQEELVHKSQRRAWMGHNDVFTLASTWLNECKDNHKICSKLYLNEWKPTRLLDVSEEGRVKLVRGEAVAAGQTYATLSHCWGESEFLVLTADNKQRFEEGMKISEFPLTFQETIETVRRLGLNYLWIDCYCIIQGRDNDRAREDWKYESLQMGKVYTNSLLNIGALKSKGPTEGLFRTRAPPFRHRFLWSPIQHIPSKNFDLTLITKTRSLHRYFIKIQYSNLIGRGWAIQECVLAPRMLSFGSKTVFWQCSKQADCDGLCQDRDRRPETADPLKGQPFWMLSSLNHSGPDTLYDINSRWMGTLERYCQSRLTYPEKDIFVALDGIGTKMANSTRIPFKYGMLGSTFPEALLYRTSKRADTGDVNRPTWHWSSGYPRAGHARIQELYNRERGHFPFFPMAYAFMSDDCKPLPTECTKDYWPKIFLIGRLLPNLPPFTSRSYDKGDSDYYAQKCDKTSSQRGECYIPLIYSHMIILGEMLFRRRILTGLILSRSESGAYHRVGIWETDFCPDLIDKRERLFPIGVTNPPGMEWDTTQVEKAQTTHFLAQIATIRPQMIVLE